MTTHDPALIEDLAKVMAETLGWCWPSTPEEWIPSSADVIRDEIITPILDRLTDLGWRAPHRAGKWSCTHCGYSTNTYPGEG